MNFLQNLLMLSLEAAPWLVLGFVIGGLMKALIPTGFLQKHLRGNSLSTVFKAALLGAPLPLCSCGVVPAAMGLREAGASRPATISFLVSTPETGVDSVSLTYAMMGPIMAIVRPISAVASALVSGLLVAFFDQKEKNSSDNPLFAGQGVSPKTACCSTADEPQAVSEPPAEKSACCDSVKPEPCCSSASQQDEEPAETSCCSSEAPAVTSCCSKESQASKDTPLNRSLSGIQYAFTDLFNGIVFWLVLGLLFAAAVKTWVPADFLAQWGSGLPAMLVMLAIGIPMYVCATASTPLAAGLILAGVSPGVALVLLLAGPATNIGTLGIINKTFGKRSMWLYLLGTCSVAVISGLLLNALLASSGTDIQTQMSHAHDHLPLWLQWSTLVILVGTFLGNRFIQRPQTAA